jgi:hypothetical protein
MTGASKTAQREAEAGRVRRRVLRPTIAAGAPIVDKSEPGPCGKPCAPDAGGEAKSNVRVNCQNDSYANLNKEIQTVVAYRAKWRSAVQLQKMLQFARRVSKVRLGGSIA